MSFRTPDFNEKGVVFLNEVWWKDYLNFKGDYHCFNGFLGLKKELDC